ncbi:Ig-like domain-containing protein [Bradyrhizobium sp.]|uniref:calcium-binding protein n=1 Tax=Bradyrhizobium sp. TaxID=376 RepID=UPI00271EA77F|nr:Ig-like domain-containing protein [Bradyrhizobium sp.]MDO9295016.1 Ig-like domain-containing protein [Bradyrhizobium sp.]
MNNLGSFVIDSSGAASFSLEHIGGGTTKTFDFAAGALIEIGTDVNGDGVFSFGSGGNLVITDNGFTNLIGGTPSVSSLLVTSNEAYGSGNLIFNYGTNYYGNGTISNSGGLFGTGYDFNNILDLDYQITSGYGLGSIYNTGLYNYYNDSISSLLVNPGNTIGYSGLDGLFGLSDLPIGAFYESRSPGHDPAPSIAAATPVVLNSLGQWVSEAYLKSLDTNHDDKLTGTELASLRAWVDGDENGVAETGEIKTLAAANISEIRAINALYYTLGNAIAAAAAITAPTKSSDAVSISRVNYVQSVPASNFRALRDTDNLYVVNGSTYYNFNGVVKIHPTYRTYMIGTDGNDSFDVGYFSATSYLNVNVLVNFLGGNGDDIVGGSTRDDNVWGGVGNDVLWGYAGHDRLYGEEGADIILANEGNDYLDGGSGDDRLFGYVGNDVLNGGDGNDLLVGFTPSDDPKQTLSAGETDNDYLYGGVGFDDLSGDFGDDYLDGGSEDDWLSGGAGNDVVFGGTGADQLQGNEGNDLLAAEAGNDLLFGQVGNDTLWGGDGDDVLVGFTASDEAKQSLFAGETDADFLYGGNGNDDLFAGFGDDTLDGGAGWDILLGQDGHDTMFGGADNDELQGGADNDRLLGEAGNDNMFGQTGNDILWGGDGDDVMLGFTGANETKQTLAVGETDDDTLYGGAGNDLMLGGLGKDALQGELGADQLQGGYGNDLLYGGDGEDLLFGQVGDDVMYGGAGDDILVGFTGYNEAKQTLSFGETDNNWLYGGAGNDLLLGGLGRDYLDGGAGADIMEGGKDDDAYIVNSVNDSILELAGEGYDFVVSSANYLLNANIEELRLLEGYNIHGTGNSLDNLIIGNSSDNILDGVTGADTMMGALGDDTYYIDHVGDQTVELAGEGIDTVQTTISMVLAANVENMILLDFAKPEKGLVDGAPALVYGYPKANELDYIQGDAVPDYWGTCALTSIANILTQANQPSTESDVVLRAIQHGWAVTDPTLPPYERGGSNYMDQQALLDSYGIRNALIEGYNEDGIANLIRSGRGVVVAVNAGILWGEAGYVDSGVVNHVVTVTGVVYGEADGELLGFYIADSGRHKVSDMTRFVDTASFMAAANVPYAYAIYTKEAIKLWDEAIDGTGNGLANNMVGNRNNNVLRGMAGNDVLSGGSGDDTLNGGDGSDTAVFSGNFADYRLGLANGVVTVTDLIENRDGIDRLIDVEFLRFADGTVPFDTPPVAHDDTGTTDVNHAAALTAASLLANDVDPDASDTKSIVSVSSKSALGAAVSLQNGQVVYDPRAAAALHGIGSGQSMSDTFTYTMRDSAGVTATATVTMTVNGVNAPSVPSGLYRIGSEFLVNTMTAANQTDPTLTAMANGGFVVTWQDSSGTLGDGFGTSIKAQLFNAAGDKVGSEFLINSQVQGYQMNPAISALAGGGFVATWESNGIRAQAFDATGAKSGSEFLVGQTGWAQIKPEVTGLADGSFVVTWQDGFYDGDQYIYGTTSSFSIQAQIYGPAGNAIGNRFQINAPTTRDQEAPDITALTNGGFVVVWQNDYDWNIKAQRFDAGGNKVGAELLVSAPTSHADVTPTIISLANGGFVVTWINSGSIAAQIFDASGQAVGSQVQVAALTGFAGYSTIPAIALANGGFVVTWIGSDSASGDSTGTSIMAQAFDGGGNKVGSAFLVNTETAGYQLNPVVAALSNGGFAVSWQDGDLYLPAGSGTLGDSSGASIKAQVFGMNAASTVAGTSGNDTLSSAGASTLIGNGGDDTYRLAQSQNSSVIVNGSAGSPAPAGTLEFTAINPNQLWLDHAGSDLVIDVLGTGQQVTIQNWYGSSGAQLAAVQAGNFELANSQIDALVQAMATFESNYAASHGGMAFNPNAASPTIVDAAVAAAVNNAWQQAA